MFKKLKFLVTILAISRVASSTMTVKKVAVIIRNGASTPKRHIYPELDFSKIGIEDTLTATGERMMFNFGTYLHKTYDKLFETDHETIKIFSNQRKSSVMTSFSIFQGAHSSHDGEKITSEEPTVLLPPMKDLGYNFNNKSSLPHGLHSSLISALYSQREPFFELELRQVCPRAFKLHGPNKFEHQYLFGDELHEHGVEGEAEAEAGEENHVEEGDDDDHDHDHRRRLLSEYLVGFEKLRRELKTAGIEPKGENLNNGWDGTNLLEFFDAVESYYYEKEAHFPQVTESIYKQLWLHKSFATEKNLFGNSTAFASVYTNNIMNYTLRFFDDLFEEEDHKDDDAHAEEDERLVRVFSTDGDQLYAFLRILKFVDPDCLMSISAGDLEYPYPTGSQQTLKTSERCLMYPRYGESLTFELGLDGSKNRFVRALYDGQPLDLKCESQNSDFFCKFEEFKKMVIFEIEHHSFQDLCRDPVRILKTIKEEKEKSKKFLLVFILSIILAIGAIIGYIVFKQKGKKIDLKEIDGALKRKDLLAPKLRRRGTAQSGLDSNSEATGGKGAKGDKKETMLLNDRKGNTAHEGLPL